MMKYAENHTWIRKNGSTWYFGITDYIRNKLGKIVHVQLPSIGTLFYEDDDIVILESSKSAIEVCIPCEGKVIRVNTQLIEDLSLLHNVPETEGWLFEFELYHPQKINNLMTLEEYQEMIQED